MRVLGLTGGVGMGKSTSAAMLQKRGVPVVDTDQLARDLVEPGQPALGEVQRAFGNDIVTVSGELRREELARRVFANAVERRALEEILHPRIRALWQARLEAWRGEGVPLAVVVIPLLFETDAAPKFDETICVACSPATQRGRLRERGWSADEIQQRIAAQLPTTQKMERSTYVVWTEGDLEVHEAQWRRILR